jgi:hypothetical protein
MAFGVISIEFSLSEEKLWLYNKLHFGDGDDEDGGSDGGGDNNGGGDGDDGRGGDGGGDGELFVELLVDGDVEMKLLERDGPSGDSGGGGDGGGDGVPFAELSVGGELEMKLMERASLSGDIERDLDRVDVDEDEDLEDWDREDSEEDEDRLLLLVRNFLSHSLYFGNGCQGPAKSPNALWVTNLQPAYWPASCWPPAGQIKVF